MTTRNSASVNAPLLCFFVYDLYSISFSSGKAFLLILSFQIHRAHNQLVQIARAYGKSCRLRMPAKPRE